MTGACCHDWAVKMREYTASILNVLVDELKIRGYQDIVCKEIDDILELEVDGRKVYVYHLDLFNPQFDCIDYALTSVLRQLEPEKFKRGDKM